MEHTIDLIERSHKGDKQARDKLVEENLGLVWSIVKRFTGRGCEMEDLFQIGSIGLIKAIDKFNTEYEVKFSTYAVPMISGEIKRFLRDDGMVKISRNLKENNWKIKHAREKLSNKLGRDAFLSEIAEETNLSVEDIVVAMEANEEVESIYKSIYQSEGNEIALLDKIPEKKDYHEELLNHILIDDLISKLTSEEQKLIQKRYFDNKTQSQIAVDMGISQVQVSRLEKKILLKLRTVVEK